MAETSQPGDDAGIATNVAPDWMTEDGARRIEQKRERFRELEKEPLRLKILVELGEAPLSPSDLADRVDAATESVSRKLSELEGEGLVSWERSPHDGRRHEYRLTQGGVMALSGHRAFGDFLQPPAPPTSEEATKFLHAALLTAITVRRKSNRLDETVERIDRVLRQAEKREAPSVMLDSIAELAITARQGQDRNLMREMVGRLEAFEAQSPGLELAAAAHLEYALGRAGEEFNEDLPTRAGRLTAAGNLYDHLAARSDGRRSLSWKERHAWSLISYAGNLRKQSKFENALQESAKAMRIFDELEDPYGRSFSLFMIGFCLRLVGHFDQAWLYLDTSHELAVEHGFERFRVDSLMQKGEVRRCQGRVEDARELLGESLEHAESLELVLTQAFAQVALGAVEYQEERLPEAARALEGATLLFERCRHDEGLALSARRHATVGRHLAEMGKESYARVLELIATARRVYGGMERSPAGIAACAIEQGRVGVKQGSEELAAALEALTKLLDDSEETLFLELDPWVPQVLDIFAKEVDQDEFAERTEAVLISAKRRFEKRAGSGIALMQDVLGGVANGAAERQADDRAYEMGGETRRESPGLVVAPA
jgi:DNA-binding MarR family transcriptional regulator